jgi:UDP-3-O-[3-hydroxymyristoyl] glucosamine N-acyltransferase
MLRRTIGDLARRLRGRLVGPADLVITGVNSLEDAGETEATFITDEVYARQWARSRAAAAVVTEGLPVDAHAAPRRALVFVPDAELAMAELLALFAPPPEVPETGVHPAAWIEPSARVDATARIGAHVSVGARCVVGAGVVLQAGAQIYADVQIGAGTTVHSGCVIRERCRIGTSVILHPGVVIGADGFGYRPSADGSRILKIQQIGNVIIEDHVEIGACTCVDRAKFGATVIGAGTKIDNLCQVGHNTRIGRMCLIAGLTGIAGSVTIGDGVVIAGAVGIADHLRIGDGARIGAFSGVIRDIPAGHTVLGYPADESGSALRQWAAIRRLPDLVRDLSRRPIEGRR